MAQDIKMRKSLMGGFRKKDVVRYVEKLNEEKELKAQELNQRIAELEDDREIKAESMMDALVADAVEQNKVLSAKVTELTRNLRASQAALDAAHEQIRRLESEKEYAFSTVAKTQAELIRVREIAEQQVADAVAQAQSTEIYNFDVLLQEIRSYRMIASALRENSRKLTESLTKQLDFADNCIDSLTKAAGTEK